MNNDVNELIEWIRQHAVIVPSFGGENYLIDKEAFDNVVKSYKQEDA